MGRHRMEDLERFIRERNLPISLGSLIYSGRDEAPCRLVKYAVRESDNKIYALVVIPRRDKEEYIFALPTEDIYISQGKAAVRYHLPDTNCITEPFDNPAKYGAIVDYRGSLCKFKDAVILIASDKGGSVVQCEPYICFGCLQDEHSTTWMKPKIEWDALFP